MKNNYFGWELLKCLEEGTVLPNSKFKDGFGLYYIYKNNSALGFPELYMIEDDGSYEIPDYSMFVNNQFEYIKNVSKIINIKDYKKNIDI